MTRRNALYLSIFMTIPLLALAFTFADDRKADDSKARPAAKASPLDRFKALAGEWTQVGDDKKTTMLSYRVTAGGSAVIETVFPGQAHEMVTVYHMDGETLMLTHYCAAGNQPRMKAVKITEDQVTFDFIGGTNMKPTDMHMHAAEFTFKDKDHFVSKWTHFDGGKATGDVVMNMTRKRA